MYSNSTIPAEPHVVEYLGDEAMRGHYKGENVDKVTVALGTSDERVAEIRGRTEEVLGERNRDSVATDMLFSTFYRVKGYWRNDQKALIAPMTDGSVAALDNELADHPFLIQFAYQSSPDPNVNVLRFRRRSRKIELLLSVLLVVTIRGSRFSSRGWVLSQEEGGEALQSTWTDLGYASGVDLNGSEWLSADGWTRLREANPNEYHSQRFGEVGFKVPKNLKAAFDRFNEIGPKMRSKFLRAAYWFQQAALVRRPINVPRFRRVGQFHQGP